MPNRRIVRLQLPDGMGAAETHAHSLASDGMVSPEELVDAAAEVGLTVLCVTDHDTTSAVDRAVERGHQVGVEVVRGQEVTTAPPSLIHVIGLFLESQVRMRMSLEDTIDAIHDQGGLAILPHPFMPTYFASIGPRRARRLLDKRVVDGIEVRHTAVMTPWGHHHLRRFYRDNRERLGAALGAGDSHFGLYDLARVVTTFPGRTAADLRHAIETCATAPMEGFDPAGPPFRLRLAQQGRSMWWLPRERRAGRVGQGDSLKVARVDHP